MCSLPMSEHRLHLHPVLPYALWALTVIMYPSILILLRIYKSIAERSKPT